MTKGLAKSGKKFGNPGKLNFFGWRERHYVILNLVSEVLRKSEEM